MGSDELERSGVSTCTRSRSECDGSLVGLCCTGCCTMMCCAVWSGVEWCGWQEKNSASETLLGNVVKKQTGEIGSGTQHGPDNGKGEGRRAQKWSWGVEAVAVDGRSSAVRDRP
jgi:hypothetical protein